MARRRTYSVAFKRQVAQEYLAGGSLHGLGKRHDLARNLIRIGVAKYEAGVFDDDARAADLLQEYEAKIAALERMVGRQGVELEFSKRASASTAAEKRIYVRHHRPRGLSVAQRMPADGSLPRSTFYDAPVAPADEAEIVARMVENLRRVRAYGYRRVGAALRHRGVVVNGKKIRRLMRAHDLQPRRRRALRRQHRVAVTIIDRHTEAYLEGRGPRSRH